MGQKNRSQLSVQLLGYVLKARGAQVKQQWVQKIFRICKISNYFFPNTVATHMLLLRDHQATMESTATPLPGTAGNGKLRPLGVQSPAEQPSHGECIFSAL